jgi:hypothetical protein
VFIQNVSLKIRRLRTEAVDWFKYVMYLNWGYSVRERSIAYSGLVGEERVAVKRGVTSHFLGNKYAKC